jgi:hypothetical protein
MQSERRSLDKAFKFLDESHRSLVADATRVFSLAEEHSETSYTSGLYTSDLQASDGYVENRITGYWQDMNESLKQMDAALTEIDEKLHETEADAIGAGEYVDLVEKKRWYGEKYNQLMDELSEIQETSLVDEKREHRRAEYERPQEEFSIEKGEMPEKRKARELVE